MPKFDQTGPAGAGPMTGRAMGPCGGGMGFGRGGCRRGFGAFASTDTESYIESLKKELSAAESYLKNQKSTK